MKASVHRIGPDTPLHSVKAEQALIGAVMIDPKAYSRVGNSVASGDFYRTDHRELWDAICQTLRDGVGVDSVTLVERLERSGAIERAGGREYVADIVSETPGSANAESYARIVREYSTKRRVGDAGRSIAALERDEASAAEVLAEAARLVAELHGSARAGKGLVGSPELVSKLLDDLERRRAGERGLSVGLPDFDALSYGLEPGDLVVLAGRPGMGKTALLVGIAAHVSRTTGVAVFSAEMPAVQLMRRAIASLSRVPQSQLRRPADIDEDGWDKIAQAADSLAARRLSVDDTPSPSLDHLRGEVLSAATRGLGLVLVDYVQLMRGEGANRYEQLRDVAYGLKALAKEAQIPIIVLAQLNRGVESREDRRPRLADLRDSGAIEEAADIIGLLYSEGYYNPDFLMPSVLECSIEKNRNGERGGCLWHFSGDTCRIGMLDERSKAEYRGLLSRQRSRGKDDDL